MGRREGAPEARTIGGVLRRQRIFSRQKLAIFVFLFFS
jgi:hypothetical protein